MNRLQNTLSITALLLFATQVSPARSYTAKSCNESDVAAAVAQSTNGDTVVIPSCPGGVTWTSNLSFTTGVTIIGQGQGSTVLNDDYSSGGTHGGLFSIGVSFPNSVRISNLTINATLVSNPGYTWGEINVNGSSHAVHIDHITFNVDPGSSKNYAIVVGSSSVSAVEGVIDHCIFNEGMTSGKAENAINVLGGPSGDQNQDWANPTGLGTSGFLFFENNTFNFPVGSPRYAVDAQDGTKYVFRHNVVYEGTYGHGTDSGGHRGIRAFEIYDNTFYATVANSQAIYMRSGTGVIWGNILNNVGSATYNQVATLANYRDVSEADLWGIYSTTDGGDSVCAGTSPFDVNAGVVYASGRASASSTGNNLIDSGSPGWTTNEWAPSTGTYSIRNVSENWGSLIDSSTSNSIISGADGYAVAHPWAPGDQYEILSVYPCLDEIGRGQGDFLNSTPVTDGSYTGTVNTSGTSVTLVSGNNFNTSWGPESQAIINSVAYPISRVASGTTLTLATSAGPQTGVSYTVQAWPSQVLEPVYEWNDTYPATVTVTVGNGGYRHVQENRDFYDAADCNITSGDQTAGVCQGLLSARPSNCTAGPGGNQNGVAYWATDANAGQGELYVCSATNTWTAYYTPYQYPHPLDTSGPSINPPTALKVISVH